MGRLSGYKSVRLSLLDNGEGYIKRYGEQQPENDSVDAYTDSYGVIHMQPVLISYNRNYADKIVRPENQFEIVGRVL